MIARGCAFILILCAPHLATFAQPSGTISGMVTDSISGEILIGAQVLLQVDSVSAAKPVPLRSVATNKFGFYSIPDIPPGRYRLSVRMLGYAVSTFECFMSGEVTPLRFDIELHQENIPFAEIVVEAERSPRLLTPVNAVSVKQDVLKGVPSLGGESDILRTLQLLPGITSESELSSGLYVRGSSPDQNLTLVDGVAIVNPAHLGGILSTFNSDAISDVQLIKGAFPAEYGGRTSSVLDITMKNGTRERLSGTAGISLLSSRMMLEGPITGNTTFMVSGRRMYFDLLLPMFANTEKTPSYYFYDLNGKVSTVLSPTDRISVSGYAGRDILTRSPANEDANFDIDWGNKALSTRWTHVLDPRAFMNLSLTYSAFNFTTRIKSSPSTGNQDYRSSSGIGDLVLQGEVQVFRREDHAVKFGIWLSRNTYEVSALDKVGDQVRASLPSSLQHSLDAVVFVQDDWRIAPPLSLNVGVRLNHMQDGSFTDLEPRLALSYRISDDVTLKGAYAIAHQYMHLVVRNDISFPTDLWVHSGDGITPSRTRQISAGMEVYLNEGSYLFSVEAYHKNMLHLYEYRETAEMTPGVPTAANFTSGVGEAYGTEILIEKKAGVFTGWIGYTLAWTTRTFAELNGGRTFYPHYDKRHDLSVVGTYKLSDRWELGATWTYSTGETYTLPAGIFYYGKTGTEGRYYLDYPERNGYRLPSFHKLDFGANHSFPWFGLPFRLSLDIYNVYNRQNPFARYIKYEQVGTMAPATYAPSLKQLTLFPFLPTLGLSCTF